MRLGNEEVLGDIEAVLNVIGQALERPSGGGTVPPQSLRDSSP